MMQHAHQQRDVEPLVRGDVVLAETPGEELAAIAEGRPRLLDISRARIVADIMDVGHAAQELGGAATDIEDAISPLRANEAGDDLLPPRRPAEYPLHHLIDERVGEDRAQSRRDFSHRSD